MARVIALLAAGLIALGLVVWLIVRYWNRADRREARKNGWSIKGDLNLAQEKVLVNQLGVAADIMRSLVGPPSSLDQLDSGETSLLSREHRNWIMLWLDDYNNTKDITRKVLGR